MKKTVIFPLLLSLSLILVSCGGGSSSSNTGIINDSQSFSPSEKAFVYDLFTTEYLWFDEVSSNVDTAPYTTPQALIDALKVPQDLWSFSITQAQYEDMVNQKTAGFGFGYSEDFTIFLVRIDAPAWEKLYRGDQIIEVNGKVATADNIAAASANLNVATTFKIIRDGSETTVSIIPSEYTFKVTQGDILPNNIGYLRYDSFTSSSVVEFESEFTKFKAANISELIIDLRYNGGGSVDVASALLDNISNQYPGQRQVYLDWNVNYQSKNSIYSFSDEVDANDLNMKRVVFLVTQNSASASEMVISALKPYLGDANVVTIGESTHGKPVGMNGRTYDINYYFLINFFVKNDDGETTSLDGIPVTCTAEDDLTHLRGDPDEIMLNTAIHYIDTGLCL